MKFVMFCGDGDVIVEFENLRNNGSKQGALRRKIPIPMFRKAMDVTNKRINQGVRHLNLVLTETGQ